MIYYIKICPKKDRAYKFKRWLIRKFIGKRFVYGDGLSHEKIFSSRHFFLKQFFSV